ncbi:hypothetical protein A6V39_05770 [Candidatus Mycoplasma haematobovis]|uniref:Uncharacterized protein n=1 Tax=Candidatus Mycoplasma haematobovis TaxID=432608 RepID=A0A1A9QFS2_9MOLU
MRTPKWLIEFVNSSKQKYLKLLEGLEEEQIPLEKKVLAREIGIELQTVENELIKAIGNLNLRWFDNEGYTNKNNT